jgi:general secretion pathway protein I
LSRKSSSRGVAGFPLIEALVALAKGTRVIDQRLALTGAAETLLAALPARNLLKPGRQSGELAGHRWRIDVAPMNLAAEAEASDAPQTRHFIPLAVTVRLEAPDGPVLQIVTVRLVPQAAE